MHDAASSNAWRIDGPTDAATTWVLAHGAGAGMDTEFMEFFARHVADYGTRVIRFEFAYMQRQREQGKRRPPDAPQRLLADWRAVIDDVAQRGWFEGVRVMGGKSMGGRLASLIADECRVDALICLGFPFQAPGKSQPERLEALRRLRTPTLIVQGTRDPFGNVDQMASLNWPPNIHVHWVADGDHDLVPRRSSGRTRQQNWQDGVDAIQRFLVTLSSARRRGVTHEQVADPRRGGR